MTIIQFIPSLRTGGAETLATNYAVQMNKLGHDVYCLVYDGDFGDSPNKEKLLSSKVKIVFLSDRSQWYYKKNILISRIVRSIIRNHKIVQSIKSINPDIIHFHLIHFRTIWKIIRLNSRATLFYTIHSELKSVFRENKNLKLAQKAVAQKKIQIIALHERMRSDCINILGADNAVCINNGIELEKYNDIQKYRNIYRKKLGIELSDNVVGHIGSFLPVKNHEYLFHVFKCVLKERRDSWLLLIGEGRLKEELKALAVDLEIDKRIIWLEKRSDIPQLLSCMDIFVFPSKFEGYPLSVIEAQAAGIRCIVSDSITDEVFVTDHIKKMSINLPAESWSKEIISPSQYNKYHGIERYDLKQIVKQIIKLYGGEGYENNRQIVS